MNIILLGDDKMPEFEIVKTYLLDHTLYCNTNGTKMVFDNDQYDIGISFMYNHLVPKKEVANHLWYNFHPGLLPEHPGRNIAYKAIMEKADKFGATIHKMTPNFDDGPIAFKQTFNILSHYTAGDLVRRSREMLVEMFIKHIDELLSGQTTLYPQDVVPYKTKHHIDDHIYVYDESLKTEILAKTCSPYYPILIINGKKFKVITQ